jgi:hypothetical protein
MSLTNISNLLLIIGIYLYFIAWVYLHTYYESFGISTESLRLDYSSYLIFSYNVIISSRFLFFVLWTGVLFLILYGTFRYLPPVKNFASGNPVVLKVLAYAALIALFPIFYSITTKTAFENYLSDRFDNNGKKRIEFIFRKNAGLDSAARSSEYALNLLYSDQGKNLRLLGESDQYFIVLNQLPFSPVANSYPEGAVYYVDKKDVLVTHIIVSSSQKASQ